MNGDETHRKVDLAVVLGIGLVASWSAYPHLLDDAFIHLRYARNLLDHGKLSYDGVAWTSGTSSPLYVGVLAVGGLGLDRVSWPAWAKALSITGSAVAVWLWLRLVREHRRLDARRWWMAGALVLALPSSLRWLQDGMETSWAVAAALWAASVARPGEGEARAESPVKGVIARGLAMASPTLLRVDGAPVSLAAVLLFVGVGGGTVGRRVATAVATLALAALQPAWSAAVFGQVMPDAAAAKATGMFQPFEGLWLLGFGAAAAAVNPAWLFGVVRALVVAWRRPSLRRQALLAVLPVAVMAGAGWARGQELHGIRHFLAPLAFAWAVNVGWSPRAEVVTPVRTYPAWRRWLGSKSLLGTACVAHAVLTFVPVVRSLRGTELYHPEALISAKTIMLYDIGRVGWSFDAKVLDLAGLVHGPEIARARPEARACRLACAFGAPDLLGLTSDQAEAALVRGTLRTGACDCVGPMRYRRTDTVLMRAHKLTQENVWWLWERIPAD